MLPILLSVLLVLGGVFMAPIDGTPAEISMLQQKARTGRATSIWWDVPANIQGQFVFKTDILFEDLVDPTKSMSIVLEDEAGLVLAGITWVGGPHLDRFGRPAGNPTISFPAADIAGKRVRLVVDPNSRVTFGASLETE